MSAVAKGAIVMLMVVSTLLVGAYLGGMKIGKEIVRAEWCETVGGQKVGDFCVRGMEIVIDFRTMP